MPIVIGNLIVFRFKEKTEQKLINQFCKKFYGQDTSSHGGKYHYRRHGLLDDIPHIKLKGGAIIVKKDSTKKLIDFLKIYEAKFYVRDVVLLHEDEVVLGNFQPI
ncbi:MAG: hypothetical protein DNFNHJIP_00138 [Candidatus Argoarchaeum ethanivorans]|uniref:DUF190 domain-containing protein n=1 Tax=Candidatus Argoarchaeum ethanivorans TaxID=2608793 RepID=A0A812A1B5_9EURY|nr:MAG: hypothetical protein DNFNHJIP_00138 [Candidatus Argoarchaeum ethanivorans]